MSIENESRHNEAIRRMAGREAVRKYPDRTLERQREVVWLNYKDYFHNDRQWYDKTVNRALRSAKGDADE
jgi:hypothetical protein